MIPRRWVISFIAMLKDYSGLCIIITVVLLVGVGSTTTTTRREYQVLSSLTCRLEVKMRICVNSRAQPSTDLRGVDKMIFNFELGKPFLPFQQLMGVLPAASKDHIPVAYQVSILLLL
jgi:hypothetical protein